MTVPRALPVRHTDREHHNSPGSSAAKGLSLDQTSHAEQSRDAYETAYEVAKRGACVSLHQCSSDRSSGVCAWCGRSRSASRRARPQRSSATWPVGCPSPNYGRGSNSNRSLRTDEISAHVVVSCARPGRRGAHHGLAVDRRRCQSVTGHRRNWRRRRSVWAEGPSLDITPAG